LMVQQFAGPIDLLALTEACVVSGGKKTRARDGQPVARVERTLRNSEGEVLGALPPQGLDPKGEGKVRCENLLDLLPASVLTGGEYVFEAALEGSGDEAGPPRVVRFSIGSTTTLPRTPKSE